jgi:hypothetical protein
MKLSKMTRGGRDFQNGCPVPFIVKSYHKKGIGLSDVGAPLEESKGRGWGVSR